MRRQRVVLYLGSTTRRWCICLRLLLSGIHGIDTLSFKQIRLQAKD